ncbi:MAG: hypothetical protein KJO42_08320 [Silicimonas sp.]|nr:hypothetical protein [Silicimonas sp.]
MGIGNDDEDVVLSDMTLIDWLGVLGSILIAGAYLAVTREWMDAARPAFNLLNLGGAALVLLSLWHRPNAGAILIEVLWVCIAVAALVRWAMRRGVGNSP